jgi:MOSC domain-containing protein YiiM
LSAARLVSVSAGRPREVVSRGKTVRTSIFKSPVAGRVRVAALNIDGDEQSDLEVHGGVDKAVYAYPMEHYAFWRRELPDLEFPWGAFGENLTTEGLSEETVAIGDRFRIGSAEFAVTQPRMPCYKLGLRFNRPEIVKAFLRSGRTGFYFAVLKEGELGAGDAVEPVGAAEPRLSVLDVTRLYASGGGDPGLLRRASELPALPQDWRDHFRERLEKGG